jgi:hypothetical protein
VPADDTRQPPAVDVVRSADGARRNGQTQLRPMGPRVLADIARAADRCDGDSAGHRPECTQEAPAVEGSLG